MIEHAHPSSLFASKSLGVHLARGAVAAGLIALAVLFHEGYPWLAAGAGIAAVVMLRGCPMCWTVGLIETVLRRRTGSAPRDPQAHRS